MHRPGPPRGGGPGGGLRGPAGRRRGEPVAEPGSIVGLIGPNGSGKTTTLDAVSGNVRGGQGSVRVDGVDLADYLPEERIGVGMVRSFQDCRLFPELSVEDVLMVCEDARRPVGVVSSTLQMPWARRAERDKRPGRRPGHRLVRPGAVPAPPDLGAVDGHPAGGGPGLDRAGRPPPPAPRRADGGDRPARGRGVRPAAPRLHEVADCTILLVEHDVPLVFELCSKVVVMETGTVVSSGTPDEVGRGPAGPGRLSRGQRGGVGGLGPGERPETGEGNRPMKVERATNNGWSPLRAGTAGRPALPPPAAGPCSCGRWPWWPLSWLGTASTWRWRRPRPARAPRPPGPRGGFWRPRALSSTPAPPPGGSSATPSTWSSRWSPSTRWPARRDSPRTSSSASRSRPSTSSSTRSTSRAASTAGRSTPSSPTSTRPTRRGMRALCKDWTEGSPAAFAVIDGIGTWTGDNQLCITQEGHTPLISQWTTVTNWTQQGAPYLWWTGPDQAAILQATVNWGPPVGLLGEGRKVGVIVGDRASDQDALNQYLLPDLQRAGVNADGRDHRRRPLRDGHHQHRGPAGGPEAQGGRGRTRSSRSSPSTSSSRSCRPRPSRSTSRSSCSSDYEESITSALGLIPVPYEQALNGQEGVTTQTLGGFDDNRPESQGGYDPGVRSCYNDLAQGLPQAPSGTSQSDYIEEQGPIQAWCTAIRLFAAAARNAGHDLNRRTFVEAMSKITELPRWLYPGAQLRAEQVLRADPVPGGGAAQQRAALVSLQAQDQRPTTGHLLGGRPQLAAAAPGAPQQLTPTRWAPPR